MRLALYIAMRYLFARRTVNIINLISYVSLAVVCVVTAAMVVVLSAFNGIEALIDTRYSSLDADLTVRATGGKYFDRDSLPAVRIQGIAGVVHAYPVLEENVLCEYEGRKLIVTAKGMTDEHLSDCQLDTLMIEGGARFATEAGNEAALLGAGVRYELNARVGESSFFPVRLTALLRGKRLAANREKALSRRNIMVAGVFSINIDFDSRYVLVPLDAAEDLLDAPGLATQYDIRLYPDADPQRVKADLQSALGHAYTVQTRTEKNSIIFKTNQSEKWITFMILSFILLIASFNIIASLTMLIIEKSQDIRILAAIGTPHATIRGIFFWDGLLINALGAGVGLMLGYLLCFVQDTWGFIPLEGGLVPYYPVEMRASDFLIIFAIVVCVGLLSAVVPVTLYTRKGLQAKT